MYQTHPGRLPNYAGSVLWWYTQPYPYLDNFTVNVGKTFDLNAPVTIFQSQSFWPANVAETDRNYQTSLYNATDNTLLCNPVCGQVQMWKIRWQLNVVLPNQEPGLIGLYSVNGGQRSNEPVIARKGKSQIIYDSTFYAISDENTIGNGHPGLWLRFICGDGGTDLIPAITSIRRISLAIDPTQEHSILAC